MLEYWNIGKSKSKKDNPKVAISYLPVCFFIALVLFNPVIPVELPLYDECKQFTLQVSKKTRQIKNTLQRRSLSTILASYR